MLKPHIAILTVAHSPGEVGSITQPALSPLLLKFISSKFEFYQRRATFTSYVEELAELCAKPIVAIVLDFVATPSDVSNQIFEQVALLRYQSTFQIPNPGFPSVIVIGKNDAEVAVQAIKAGALDYLVRERVTAQRLMGVLYSSIESVSAKENPVGAGNLTEISTEIGSYHSSQGESLPTGRARNQSIEYGVQTVAEYSPAEYSPSRHSTIKQTTVEQKPESRDRVYLNPDPDPTNFVPLHQQQPLELPLEQPLPLIDLDGDRPLPTTPLTDKETRLRGFVESNVVGILYGDIHGNIFEANDELLRIVGYTREDLEAGRLQWIEMTPPEYLPLDVEGIAEAQERGACTPYEKEYIRKDGDRIPVLIGYSLLGERREDSVVFVLDLSRHKRTEMSLRRSEDRLRLALESAQLGTWDWNLSTSQIIWDVRCKAMFGLSPDAEVTVDTFFAGLHPDERDRLTPIVQASLPPASDGRYAVEFRTIGIEDGIERWLLAKGQVYFAPDGTPHRFIGTLLDITERKQAEATLRESEERLQLAIEGAGGALWDWNILAQSDYLSPEWLEMLGYDRGELPLKVCSWESLIHPEDKPGVMEKLDAHLRDSAIPFMAEYRMLTKNGDWKWIADYGKVVKRDTTGDPIRMAGIHLDISDRKQAEERLRLSEARYRTLANAVSQLMWVNSADGRIEFFNHRWKDYTGVEDLELGVGLWADIIHPQDFETANSTRLEAIQVKRAYEVEVRLKRHDGHYRWHLARILPLKNEQDEVINWFGTAMDIHDRKCAEAEREQLLQQEQAARTAAEQANRVKDEFLAILSHELRSPLNPILGWAQLLKTKKLDAAKTARALETIERNAKLQTQLIDDLLDIARILRGKLKLDNAPVSLVSTIEAAVETVKTATTAKVIDLKTDLEDIGNVWGDATRIQQIIWNLLSNAIKFTPAQGQIVVQLRRVGNQGQICITDTGKGIRPDFLPHIFESFRQEDVSITRRYGGLGLGLAIVRYLVEAHGGAIAAESPGEGQGSTFVVTLPLISQDTETESQDRAAPDTLNFAGIRVLAIDDDNDSRELLSTLLSQYGAEVVAVASAEEALEEFLDEEPDLLISDLGMPNMDGYELLRKIRSLSADKEEPIPAIALTAYARVEDQQRTLANGFQRHIPKPIEVDMLLQTITELV